MSRKLVKVNIMKHFIFFLLGVVLCCSCSSTDSIDEVSVNQKELSLNISEEEQLAFVNSQIDSLNQSMYPQVVQTRGLGKFFKRFIAVVVCDAVGGLFGNSCLGPCGAAAGAIAASGLAAIVPIENISFQRTRAISNSDVSTLRLMPMNSETLALTPSLVPIQGSSMSGMATKEDSIGYYHNKVILELNKTVKPEDLTINSIVDKVAETTCANYGESKDQVLRQLNSNIDFFEDIMDKQYPISGQFNSLHDVIQQWTVQYPSHSAKLLLLETFFEGVSNLKVEENEGEYLEKVLLIIKNSSLDEDLKQDLRNAFIVGNASYQLWNVEE